MQYVKLGNTDIEVSRIAFGCWAIIGGEAWGHQDKQDSLDAIRAAYDAGVTFFDTAEGYGGGESEQLVGEGLAGIRDNVRIATKVSGNHFKPAELRRACDRSLGYLGTDRIDLYQLHWPNRKIPLAETLGVLQELKQEGKLLSFGVSNFGKQDIRDAFDSGHAIVSDQVAYNLLFRAIEYEVLPTCREHDISVLCYSPLLQGLLTGKFASPKDVPEHRTRSRHFSSSRPGSRHGESGAEEETFHAIGNIRAFADELGESMADFSLAWLLAQPGVTCVIVGGRNADQARRNTRAMNLSLSEDVFSRLSDITAPLKETLGPNADMWQGESRIR